ncbi:hypothetical protein [Streptomyces sp. NPDC058739]|uniref:hypothetical protein n=1 Tax=Streptomyces sp. NPDC058739 TaxID=3346618 RepID=UPI003689FF05
MASTSRKPGQNLVSATEAIGAGGRDGGVHAWNPESGRTERLLLLNHPIQALEVTSRNELFVAAGDEIIAFRGEPRSDR